MPVVMCYRRFVCMYMHELDGRADNAAAYTAVGSSVEQ